MRATAVAALALALLMFAGCRAQPRPAGTEPTAGLPPDAAAAPLRLDQSPRHGEWVDIPTGAGDSVRAWVVFPERSGPAPVVLVVHEIYGLTGWIRSVADQLAAEGFVAIAPDLLSGRGVPADSTGDPVRDAAVREVRALDADFVHGRLRRVAEWGMALPAAADQYGIMGFCWGGSTAFAHATRYGDLGAAVVYYGTSPDPAELRGVGAPVLGLYGGDDARVNATIPAADSAMRALGKPYEVRIYDGAGHGFLRQQDGREGANRAATEQAWPETIRWLRTHLDG